MKPCVVLAAMMCMAMFGFAQSVFPVRDDGEGPSRNYHLMHYRIEVSFDEHAKSVRGTTTTTLVCLQPGLTTIELDAENMSILSVTARGKALPFEVRPKKLVITLDTPRDLDDTLSVSVKYTCTPARGLYFTQPDSSYPDRPWQIWSQGEDMDNHFWFPCYDFPNDMATSEMIATVRSSYVALSNGRLVDVMEDKAKNTKTFHWREDIPHASYLISLAAGNYAILKDRAGDIPLEYYVYPGQTADAGICFAATPDMVRWFSEKIGYKYPWEKYAQVLIHDFIEGGMENVSATSLADDATVYDARARVDESPTSLIAHELAHQWWGDVVTCRDWRHLWLNESFASYFDPLWHEHALGKDEFDYTMFNAQRSGINADKRLGRKPIVSVGSYGDNIYPRGASVLHMLRFVLGDKLFWRALHHYIMKYQHTPVETADLTTAIEEATGQNLYWFFDEWVYKAGYPVFDLSYAWNDSARSIALHVRQTQKTDSLTAVFRMPVDVEVTTPGGAFTRRVNILTGDTILTLPADAQPRLVIFDKGNWLLKEMKWTKTQEEWFYQAEHAANPVDRLLAVREISGMHSGTQSLSLLAGIALKDPFWAVRREAVDALEKFDSLDTGGKRELTAALMAAAADRKPDVRAAAVTQLGLCRGDTVSMSLRGALRDSSYRVVAAALRSIAKVDSASARDILLAYMDVPSHRNVIASSALRSLATVDSAGALDLALLKGRSGQPTEMRFASLGILGRYGKGKEDVLRLLESIALERQSFVRSFAIRILGDIGNAQVLPLLENIAADGKDRSADAAKASAQKIRKRTGEKHL
ncbi:MAG TPA: M1 family metallopeptidase [Bacteroidota bacterium]|nr:M1 family metallopeptidase [Bacteroidota bacterium]